MAGIFLLLYVILSLPYVQKQICSKAEKELSNLFETRVSIERMDFTPFNQIELYGVHVPSPDGKKCIDADKIGAGISIWKLISTGDIVITYAELIGLDCRLSKKSPTSKLNIQFLIDAFKPKEKNKPPIRFYLKIHSIVIRKSILTFDKTWIPTDSNPDKMDFNHIALSNIRADINIPRLRNDDYIVDLRSLSLQEKSGFIIENLSSKIELTNHKLCVTDLSIEMPGTILRPSDISLQFNGYSDIVSALKRESHKLSLSGDKVTLNDFSSIIPALKTFSNPMTLSLDAQGNLDRIDLTHFLISTPDGRLSISANGYTLNPTIKESFLAEAENLKIDVTAEEAEKIITRLTNLPSSVRGMLLRLGAINLEASAKISSKSLDARTILASSLGQIETIGKIYYPAKNILNGSIQTSTSGFNLGTLLADKQIGELALRAETELDIAGKNIDGTLSAVVDKVEYGGMKLSEIIINASKNESDAEVSVEAHDHNLNLSSDAILHLDGQNTTIHTDIDVRRFNPSAFKIHPDSKHNEYHISGKLSADIKGNSPDNAIGEINVENLHITSNLKPDLRLNHLGISAQNEEGKRTVKLKSDWLDAAIEGDFIPTKLPSAFISILSQTIPALRTALPETNSIEQNFSFNIDIHNNNSLTEFFNLPFRLLTPIPIQGNLLDSVGTASVYIDIPYIQQGKNKLVRDTKLGAVLDASTGGSRLDFATKMPGKKGDIFLSLNVNGLHDNINTDLGWKIHREGQYDGNISLSTTLRQAIKGNLMPGIDIKINPSKVHVAGKSWDISPATLSWHDNKIIADNIHVSNGPQYVVINGIASRLPTDSLSVQFSDFSLDYLFETLNINYVTFGGNATGKALATSVLSSNPIAETEGLTVKNLTYNGALLGDSAEIKGTWDNNRKCVGIYADIYERKQRRATVDGGVWVVGDSLSFDFDADKVNIQFLKPFMSAFTSDVKGRASGKAKLYGTFKDIDMSGRLFADTIRMKVDYTNTWYSGSDSVIINPGEINIPSFRLYDRQGNSARFSGVVTHKYFHEPSFEFRMTDARGLLAYDTNSNINPDWYGTVFINGSASVKGRPGIVTIDVDVSTSAKSQFTYVLSDTEAAEEYSFLTFTDRRKEASEKNVIDTVPEFVRSFRKKVAEESGRPSIFAIDLRVSVTPDAQIFIIMDPRAGDKISARGKGAMKIAYDSESDDMTMYGKYTIDEGNYLFTLQDLIIRDFKINPGSSIAFNGNPLNASLNIDATYRVNTNLTDLDKSFSTDRDLNRTNVPVDAVLKVGGGLQDPEISYDIKLPTLTSDVERKVKSIISTDDMLSRQVLYLLALNKFYTPEYMSQSGSGGELASVASSTISSQITNILGQISDKWAIAPSFRSDKGDFSDTEVDLALTSRLLNNRLLINGNFGYRDRSTSQTTFVGDFDIEYLLNRSGNLRLKAYNHFNDQNYYLRSSLTTQGLGIIYRRDFDNPFTFLRRRKKVPIKIQNIEAVGDSLPTEDTTHIK